VTHLISTTMRPDQVVEVEDAEYTDLQRQGLVLVDHTEQAEAAAPATTKKAASPAANKEG
jgi:hypothetical protein